MKGTHCHTNGSNKDERHASDQEDDAEKKLEPGAEIIWTKSFFEIRGQEPFLWVRQAPKVQRNQAAIRNRSLFREAFLSLWPIPLQRRR